MKDKTLSAGTEKGDKVAVFPLDSSHHTGWSLSITQLAKTLCVKA